MVNLVRWTPEKLIGDARSFDQLFNELWRSVWANWPMAFDTDTARPVLRPPMDVMEDENGLTVRVELPGLTAEDVSVEVEGDLLTISGEFKAAEEREGVRYYLRERCAGPFRRSLRLSDTVDVEHISATFENGVLTLALPKRPEAQPKRIEVRTAS
jgi:HSP20 family protein